MEFFRPYGTSPRFDRTIPAMNRWAIFFRPPGWKADRSRPIGLSMPPGRQVDFHRLPFGLGTRRATDRRVTCSPVPQGRERIARRFIAGSKSQERSKSRRDERTEGRSASQVWMTWRNTSITSE